MVGLSQFLEHIVSSREVSLAVTADTESLAEMVEVVSAGGFTRCEDAFAMIRAIQVPRYLVFTVLTADAPKPLYDFVVQYPTGMVQLGHPDSLTQVVAHASWENNAVLVVATRKTMEATQTKGYRFLEGVGMCWQPL